VSPLPDESVKKKNELLRQVTELKDKEITFKQWKKVQDGEKYRHKEVQEVREKAVFLTDIESLYLTSVTVDQCNVYGYNFPLHRYCDVNDNSIDFCELGS
jgi:hypothetical protein